MSKSRFKAPSDLRVTRRLEMALENVNTHEKLRL